MKQYLKEYFNLKAIGLGVLFVISITVNSYAQRRGGAAQHAGPKRSAPSRTPAQRPAAQRPAAQRPATQRPSTVKKPGNSSIGANNRKPAVSNNKVGNKTNIGNKTSVGNRNTNIKGGHNNVNVNINNSHNTNIRRNTTVRRNVGRPYTRAPHVYGGRRYYSYHPYFYHPYRPFMWGPIYHPWGFFVATLATTAIIVSVENQKYHYDQGMYYTPTSGGYTVVAAPVGAVITTLPKGYETVVVNETTNNYYYGGTYYEKDSGGYKVVPPTSGTVVTHLPDGGKEVKMGDITYVQVGETYYQPIQQDGKDVYEVVDVQSE
ncbi:DUF6515 family protein [Pedobacter sp. MW01-1-1]|uniref:DUF6515 family protein n=1 Tax=Pedobacter sp. MW01-1-1 TaxID=3383027 RepID=UPI003FF0323C